jgi:hypothetical protein
VSKFNAIPWKLEVYQWITFNSARQYIGDFVQVFVTQASDRVCGFGQGSIFLVRQR